MRVFDFKMLAAALQFVQLRRMMAAHWTASPLAGTMSAAALSRSGCSCSMSRASFSTTRGSPYSLGSKIASRVPQRSSESGACGNGARCVAYRLMRDGEAGVLQMETKAGVLECRRESDFVFRVDMGPPHLGWRDIPLRDPVENTNSVALLD